MFVFRVGDARVSRIELKGVYDRSEDRVFRERGNKIVEEFRGCQERGLYRVAKAGWDSPMVG